MLPSPMADEHSTNTPDAPQDLETDRLFVRAQVLSLDGYKGITDESARVLAPLIGGEFKSSYSALVVSGLID